MSAQAQTIDTIRPARLDKRVFYISLATVLILSLLMTVFPEIASDYAQRAMKWITHHFGWFYLLVGTLPLIFCGWLAFGRYGQIKFGTLDEKPEYSTISWVGMMFTASMGASLIAWGFAEPIYYIETPPLGILAHSTEAFEWAHVYPIFHWGFTPWAMYCLPTIPIAYMLFIHKTASLKISDSCEALLPDKKDSVAWTLLDIFVVLGVVGGVATSLGFGVPLVTSLAVKLLGVEDNLTTNIFVVLIWTMLFGTSAYLGLKRGIKLLADINIGLMFVVMAFILIAGPTLYLLNITTNSIGLFLNNMLRMTFWTDPIEKGGFPEAWTIFYWAWWIAYAPMMGLFFARISRGRTIKNVVLGIIGFGSLGTFLFLSLAGGYVLYLQGNDLLDAAYIMRTQGMAPLVAEVINQLPFPTVILTVVTILSLIFYATTFDSAAYILASICTKDLPSHEEPNRMNRVAWALGRGIMAVGLMVAGGFETVKAMTVVSSLPIIPIIFMMCFTLVTWLQRDFPQLSRLPPIIRQDPPAN
jgi:BCCT family betaine/carnitine transporter